MQHRFPVTEVTLGNLAAPLERGDFESFVASVERLHQDEKFVLAVIGAAELLYGESGREYLSSGMRLELMGWILDFKRVNIEEWSAQVTDLPTSPNPPDE